jgi:hypothetical protein
LQLEISLELLKNEFVIGLVLFIIFFVLVNYVQSIIGIYPKLAKKYKTGLNVSDRSLFKLRDINLTNDIEFSIGKNDEYRSWLTIKSFDQGLFIGQERMLILLFPKKFLIPWEQISFIKEKVTLLKKQYIYKVDCNKKPIYIITKFDVFNSATNKALKQD